MANTLLDDNLSAYLFETGSLGVDDGTEGFTLTEIGSPGTRTGHIENNALDLNGSTQYLTGADPDHLNFQDTTWSCNAWINADVQAPAGSWRTVHGIWDTANFNRMFWVNWENFAGSNVGHRFDMSSDGNDDFALRHNDTPSTGTDYMVSMGYVAGTDTFWSRVDNANELTTTVTGGMNDGGATVPAYQIGAFVGGSDRRWDGAIEQVAFWTRDIRIGGASSDLAELYNSGTGLARSGWQSSTGGVLVPRYYQQMIGAQG